VIINRRLTRIIFILLLVLHTSYIRANCHLDDDSLTVRLEELVLKENLLRNVYFVKKLSSEEIVEYKISYIGDVHNIKGHFKFIFISTYSGLYKDSKKCRSRIIIYKKNLRYGEYYIGGHFDNIPLIIDSSVVITPNADGHCDQITRLDFKQELMNQIFIPCKEKDGKLFGDIYYFKVY